jgi:hypothetical protein
MKKTLVRVSIVTILYFAAFATVGLAQGPKGTGSERIRTRDGAHTVHHSHPRLLKAFHSHKHGLKHGPRQVRGRRGLIHRGR